MTNQTTTQLATLEQAARKADEQVNEVRDRAGARNARIAHLRSERLRLAIEQPSMFDKDGRPKAKTDAAKLEAELDAERDSNLGTVLEAAEERARQARRALQDYKRDHAVELAHALRPDAERVTEDLRSHLEGIIRATDAYFALERKSSALLEPLSGLNAQDLPPSDRIAQLRRFASRELGETLPLPLPRSLVEQPGYPSLKVQVPGGWVRPQNAPADQVVA